MRNKILPLITLFVLILAALSGCSQIRQLMPRPPIIVSLERTGEFIHRWYICGPFLREGALALRKRYANADAVAMPDGRYLCRESFNTRTGEASWVLRETETLGMSPGDPVMGRTRGDEVQCIDFLQAFPIASIGSSAYALAFIDSPTAEIRNVTVGSDDGITIWLNGEKIHHSEKVRPLVPDEDFLIAAFRPGINVLLVEVTNVRGNWGFMLRICPAFGPPPLSVLTD